MSEIDDFVENLVNKYEIFANSLFIDDSAEIFDDDHDSVEQLQNVGG